MKAYCCSCSCKNNNRSEKAIVMTYLILKSVSLILLHSYNKQRELLQIYFLGLFNRNFLERSSWMWLVINNKILNFLFVANKINLHFLWNSTVFLIAKTRQKTPPVCRRPPKSILNFINDVGSMEYSVGNYNTC